MFDALISEEQFKLNKKIVRTQYFALRDIDDEYLNASGTVAFNGFYELMQIVMKDEFSDVVDGYYKWKEESGLNDPSYEPEDYEEFVVRWMSRFFRFS